METLRVRVTHSSDPERRPKPPGMPIEMEILGDQENARFAHDTSPDNTGNSPAARSV
jgi:hypothetical protein